MKTSNLGLIPYQEAHELQLATVQSVMDEKSPDTLLVCSHPSVVTLGKKSSDNDIHGWQGDIVRIARGGQATYHGPGQVIIYPILNLKHYQQNISGFLEAMESAMIKLLADYGLEATGNPKRGEPDYTGVWVGPYKVASIGVAIKKWVTYHGLAINIYKDHLAFQGINPCGFSSSTMTCMEDLLPTQQISRSEVEDKLCHYLWSELSKLR